VQRFVIIGICQVHHASVQPAEQVDALLTVVLAVVFPAHNGMVEDRFGANEVVAMLGDVRLAFGFVPSQRGSVYPCTAQDARLFVSTKSMGLVRLAWVGL
jgi:hypothetical protein